MVAGLLNPRRCYGSKFAFLIGVAYPFGPVDIIPNGLPVIGHLDQVAFVLGGPALAYLLLTPPYRRRVAAARPAIASAQGLSARARAWLLDGFAAAFALPLLRLATGAWPHKREVASFRYAFRRFTPLPPLMRALATIPAGREQLTRAMLASWLLADEAYRGRLARELAGDDQRPGSPLRVWSGPRVTFLHIEKTAGMAMMAALTAQFHPLQIDADVRRAHPPHLFCHLPPFLLPQVRPCVGPLRCTIDRPAGGRAIYLHHASRTAGTDQIAVRILARKGGAGFGLERNESAGAAGATSGFRCFPAVARSDGGQLHR
jgi:hypothetical protein